MNDLPPQPPPSLPAPPAGEAAVRSKRWMIGIVALGLAAIVTLIAPLFLLRESRFGSDMQASSNARQIGLALFDFDSDYGRFPDASTIAAVKENAHPDWDLKARTSNDLFKQLIAAGIVTSEEIFYAKALGAKKPDNVILPESKILERGECGFAYIAGASTKCDPARPLAVTPLIPGTLLFDPKPFEGKAIVLRADNSAVSYQIQSDGRVFGPGGKDLFDPSQPYWIGAPPDVKWADLPVPPPPPPLAPFLDPAWWWLGLMGLGGTMMFFLWKRRHPRNTVVKAA